MLTFLSSENFSAMNYLSVVFSQGFLPAFCYPNNSYVVPFKFIQRITVSSLILMSFPHLLFIYFKALLQYLLLYGDMMQLSFQLIDSVLNIYYVDEGY